MLDIAAANRYLTEEERGWLKEAREEIAMDAVGLCHDVPVMLGRYAAALEALEESESARAKSTDDWDRSFREVEALAKRFLGERDEAQGKLEVVRQLNSHLIPSHSPVLDRILRGTKEEE